MISDLFTAPVFQTETEITPASVKIKTTLLKSTVFKVKQLGKWINPKNWFSRFSTIDIDMSEFACKKTQPKE